MEIKIGITFKSKSDNDIIQTVVGFRDGGKTTIVHYFDVIDPVSQLPNIYNQEDILNLYEEKKDDQFFLETNDYLTLTTKALEVGLETGYFYPFRPA